MVTHVWLRRGRSFTLAAATHTASPPLRLPLHHRSVPDAHAVPGQIPSLDAQHAQAHVELEREGGVLAVRDVVLPENMKRALARQAEAKPDRCAKEINAEGEFEAASRHLKTVSEVSEQQLRPCSDPDGVPGRVQGARGARGRGRPPENQ